MRAPFIALSTLLCALVACGPDWDPNSGQVDAGPDDNRPDARSTPNEFADAAPPEVCSKIDIVFVIDDSGSMSEEQSNLAANFPQFATNLEDYVTSNGDSLDYRVAITTTGRDITYTQEPLPIPISESGDNGAFLNMPGVGRRWLQRGDADVVGTFSSVANVGTGGPSFEMPLMMLDWAFHDRTDDGTNAGFLRDDALLAMVVLTDEDDCSRSGNNWQLGLFDDLCDPNELFPITDYTTMLDDLKDERGRWAMAVIAGETTCESAYGGATEAVRLKNFVAETGENAVFSSICDSDLASSLTAALEKFQAACEAFPPIE